ncbi:MAG: hypothetical protein C4331_10555 [Meiothermus sp.]
MAFWRFSDDTLLRTGALVEGHSAFARHLRAELFDLAFGEGPLVWLSRGLDGAVGFDPHDDWLLHLWAHNEAYLAGLEVQETDCHFSEADIPPAVREHLRRNRLTHLLQSPEELPH